MRRRPFLAGLAALAGATACARPAPPAPAPTPEPWSEPDAWAGLAQGIIRDLRGTLDVFDAYTAFRGSDGPPPSSGGSDLPWDPPTTSAWLGATAALGDLRARAAALGATIDRSVAPDSRWQERRQRAAAAQQLSTAVDAASEYRQAIDEIPPGARGVGVAAVEALDRAWSLWNACAADWGVAAAETFSCG